MIATDIAVIFIMLGGAWQIIPPLRRTGLGLKLLTVGVLIAAASGFIK